MSTARNGLVSEEALDVEDRSTSRAQTGRAQKEAGGPSRVRRREAYLVALAAGLAAIGVCVASYMSDARRHAEESPATGAVAP